MNDNPRKIGFFWTDARLQRAVAIRNAGVTWKQVAEELTDEFGVQITASSVNAAVRESGLEKPVRKHVRKPGKAERPCMVCARPFVNSGPGHRLCGYCAKTAASYPAQFQ